MRATALPLLAAIGLGACSGDEGAGAAAQEPGMTRAPVCQVLATGVALPEELRETSGLARSAHDPERFWSHNDAGHEPVLFAIAQDGQLLQRVRVTGAELVDWEDIEAAPCDAGACLFIGDIGDNSGRREHITVYRVSEPRATDAATAPAVALRARYPGGPRDAEGLFVDGPGRLHVVTKGRNSDIELYRFPAAERAGEVVTLELVRRFSPEPQNSLDRVTAATATPDRRWIGIRTYRTLYLYPAADLVDGRDVTPVTVDLTPLGEEQGESLVLADDGLVWTTSEAEGGGIPRLSRLRCTLPDASERSSVR